jgi:hypothetical protein
MVTLLFTSIFVLGLLTIAIYFWQKPANTSQTIELPVPPPQPASLFSGHQPAQLPRATDDPRNMLLESAAKGEKTCLQQAHSLNDPVLYEEVLNTFVASIDSEPELLSLVSYVTRNELPLTKALAQTSMDYWKDSLDRHSTAKMLHLAALSDDADTYRQAIEVVLSSWRNGKIPDLSALELQSLINGEFWVLSSNTRSSGAGFVLKRTLATASRELKTTI